MATAPLGAFVPGDSTGTPEYVTHTDGRRAPAELVALAECHVKRTGSPVAAFEMAVAAYNDPKIDAALRAVSRTDDNSHRRAYRSMLQKRGRRGRLPISLENRPPMVTVCAYAVGMTGVSFLQGGRRRPAGRLPCGTDAS